MTVNERMKEIRKDAKLTQTEFAKRVGISMSSISQMERGKINPTSQTIEFACREFNINREWLETGNGDMKKPPLDEVAEIVSDILDKGNEDLFYGFILAATKAYQELGERDKEFVQSYINKMLTIQHDSFSKDTEE